VFIAYASITAITIVATAAVAVADLVRARFVLATMDEVGVPLSWLAPLGMVKAAAVAGLLLGLFGPRPLGTAAAAGLVVFFAAALATHVRARVFHNIAFPAAFFVSGHRGYGPGSPHPLTPGPPPPDRRSHRSRSSTVAPTGRQAGWYPGPRTSIPG
jgi:DoxX-like protein